MENIVYEARQGQEVLIVVLGKIDSQGSKVMTLPPEVISFACGGRSYIKYTKNTHLESGTNEKKPLALWTALPRRESYPRLP